MLQWPRLYADLPRSECGAAIFNLTYGARETSASREMTGRVRVRTCSSSSSRLYARHVSAPAASMHSRVWDDGRVKYTAPDAWVHVHEDEDTS